MKNFFKGRTATILVVIATFILAGIAVFTAIRLYQLRQEAVAPNVPESIPQAAAPACSLSFSLTFSSAVVCSSKRAFKDVASNSAGSYDISSTNLLASEATVSAGQKIVYVIKPGPANVTKQITITDTLPTKVTFLDSDNVCSYTSATRVVTCTLGGTNTQAAFRVTVNAGATGTIDNSATLTGQGDSPSTCSVSLALPGATATPTPTATPTATPTGSPTATPTATPTSTVGPTATPQPPTLPESGADWPTYIGTGFGVLIILGSLLLAL